MVVKLVVLDFDGVIIDSVHECHILTAKAFEKMGEKLNSTTQSEDNFRKAGSFVIAAEDYFYIAKALKDGVNFEYMNLESFR